MIFSLYAADNRFEDHLFHRTNDSGALVVKKVVEPYRCPHCGKFDEAKVIVELNRHLEFQSKVKDEAFSTLDDWIVVKPELAQKLKYYKIDVFAVNEAESLFALMPEMFAVDLKTAGFEFFGGQCESCNRPKESVVGPLVASHELPDSKPLIWSTKIHNESIRGARLGVWFEQENLRVVKSLFGKKFEYMEAF